MITSVLVGGCATLLGCASGGSGGAGAVRKGLVAADPTNPFPEKILGHRVFLIFRSVEQNLLGYTMRPGLEKLQVFGAKFWQGKEKPGRGAGEDRTIVFNRKQARRVGAALPGIGFSNSYKGDVSFKLVLKGLRVSQLSVPVLEQEYRDLPEARTSPFVVSLLSADEVLIQAVVKEAGGTRVGSRADAAGVFAGNVNYSESAKGVVAARNRIIGYITSRPRQEDLARRATSKSLRRLGIFDLNDKTGNADFAFLASTMRHKLEEAFQSIPKFHVVTDRKEDAKYHLRGSYRRIGSRVQFELSLKNTYNQKLEHKIVRVIKADNVDHLYDYQIKVVGDFARKFGVSLKAEDKQRLTSVVRQAKDLTRLKEYRKLHALFKKGKYKQCLAGIRPLAEQDKEYLDAWLLYAECTLRLSRYLEATPLVEHVLKLAKHTKNPRAQSRAYRLEGSIYFGKNDLRGNYRSIEKSYQVLRVALGPTHPDVADALINVSWARMLMARYHSKSKAEKRKLLNQSVQDILFTLNIFKAHFGSDDKRMIPIYSGLANYQRKLGRKTESITNELTALRLVKKHYGPHSIKTARSLRNVGYNYFLGKRYGDAERLYKQADEAYRRALGDTVNLSRSIHYFVMSYFYYKTDRYELSLKYARLNLQARKKLFGHVKGHRYIRSAQRRMGYAVMKGHKDIHGALRYWRAGKGIAKAMPELAKYLRGRYWVSAGNGEIPKGAPAIGPDYNNKALFACRVQVDGDVFFGKVRPVYGACNYARGGREVRAKKYHVLVLKDPSAWEKAESGAIKNSWRIMDVALYPRPRKGAGKGVKKTAKPDTGPNGKLDTGPNGKLDKRVKKVDEILYLCRAKYQGSTVIGSVRKGRTNTCRFGYGGTAYGLANYEVLAGEKITTVVP